MKHRYPLLLLAALLTNRPVVAQTAPGPMSNFAQVPLTRQDTARAVHELFQRRRGGGFGWLAFGGAGMAASIIPAQQTTSAGVWTPGVVFGAGFSVLGIKKLVQFGWGREHRVLRQLAATGHLPGDVRRRLRGNFAPLHGTASAPDPLASNGLAPAPVSPVATPSSTQPETERPAAATVPVTSPVQALADARQDTLDAVQGFFNARRLGGQLPILLALPGLRLMTGATKTGTPSPSPYVQTQRSDPSGGQVAAGLLLMAGGVTYMFVHNAPYSDKKFSALRTSYLAGAPLPPEIRARLKPQHLAAGRKYRERLERRAARRQ
ncbi:hypothetical protein ACFST9_05085 [Hymenobacter monticola]|uniref:Uncharacterized protein n=1 Tax=Hymenobacter monticola TaxID=1705399 RepID=A0ABY4BH91_9BACT|nr:hypothetical protein [Hymenobacter monticola]UOE35995.1 hypothetical protein MTP16_10215 [Hymenobacter monticola]